MSEENLKIADILFAYIKGTISECELEELTKWVERKLLASAVRQADGGLVILLAEAGDEKIGRAHV